MTEPEARDDFRLTWHGNVLVISPAGPVEAMEWDLVEHAAEIVMQPIRQAQVPMVVFDLSDVNYFGSVFLQLLLRCHTHVRTRGGEMVLCGVSPTAAELLQITSLDTLWAIYETREEAVMALAS